GRIGDAVIAVRNKVAIRVRDVASVEQGAALRTGDALIMGRPGVLISLASQYGANTLTATRALEQALAELAPALKAQGITLFAGLHRPANLLIAAILYVFLRDLRAALIAFSAIPLSLLAAVLVLGRMGHTLNTMTLG